MKIYRVILPSVIALLLSSCTQSSAPKIETIPVDVRLSKDLDISLGTLIELETTDRSPLHDVTQLEFINEKMIVLSYDQVFAFDRQGKFLFNVGAKGQGSGEYIHLAGMFVRDGRIYLVDSFSRKALCFNENGQFLFSIDMSGNAQFPTTEIYPLKDGTFVAFNSFQGDQNPIPIASRLDENLQFVDTISGRNHLSAYGSGNSFFQHRDRILYWEVLNDTIYVINNNTITPRYWVDFGEQAIQSHERRDKSVYNLYEFVQLPENKDRIASFFGQLEEDEACLRFKFRYNRDLYYTFYNKTAQTARTYRFVDASGRFRTGRYAAYIDDCLYLSVFPEGDLEKNPSLVVLAKSVFGG
jgi:hypothetical protein